MKDLDSVFSDIRAWKSAGGVGTYKVMARPDGSYTCAVEQIIKLRELPKAVAYSINDIMGFAKTSKMKVLSKDGAPDRIEVDRLR